MVLEAELRFPAFAFFKDWAYLMSDNSDASNSEDEIDFAELFMSLWSQKLPIAIGTAIAIFLGANYALNLPKVYISTAKFAIAQGGGMNIPSQFSAVAALVGGGGNVGSQGLSPEDILSSRQFVHKVSVEANLVTDENFNTDQGVRYSSLWKDTLKRILGLTSEPVELTRRQAENVFKSFSNLVSLNKTLSGTQSISVTHTNPERAAEIANDVLDLMIVELEAAQGKTQDARLTYLSSSLADALQNLDKTQGNLKDYALNNNMLSVQTFSSQSVALDNLRKTRVETVNLLAAVKAVAAAVNAGNVSNGNLKNLRILYPVLDDANFRRLFGVTEIISEWSWPEVPAMRVVASTLADRIKRLNADIIKLEADAQQYGRASEELFKLEREAKVAEATYTVLIEQVKAQSLSAGFRPEIASIYDRAIAPISPRNRNLMKIVALSAVLGAVFSMGLALIVTMRRDVYWTNSSLLDLLGNTLIISIGGMRALRSGLKSDARIKLRTLSSNSLSKWRVDVCEKPSNLVLIASLNSRVSSDAVSEWLAMRCSDDGKSVAVLMKGSDEATPSADTSDIFPPLLVAEMDGNETHITLPPSLNSSEFYASTHFRSTIEKMRREFDLVIIASDGHDAEILVRVLRGQQPHFTIITRAGATKKNKIRLLIDLIKVDACIHE